MLRYDAYGRPIGLDWTVCNDGNPRPEVWDPSYVPKTPKKKRPPIKNHGIGRGGLTRVPARIAREMIELYKNTTESPKEIGARFGYSRQAVYKVLWRYNIQTRTRSEAMVFHFESKGATQ